MLNTFIDFIHKKHLLQKNDKVLLAVSGGIDSVVMCELFHQAALQFGIAHCNLKLRGKESDEDEGFVKQLAGKYVATATTRKVEYYSEEFETQKYAKKEQISLQMAARHLRYEWLEKIRKNNGYLFIATAHHQNDSIETLLFNLIKGTGIAGLHGIQPKVGKLIRPLLFATKQEIEGFAKKNLLSFRQDSSNQSDKYVRNKIRNKVIPVLKEINPSLEDTFTDNIERFKDIELIYDQAIVAYKKQLYEYKVTDRRLPAHRRLPDDEIFIPIRKLLKLSPVKTILYELLKDFHFNIEQVEQMISVFEKESGKIFLSSSHRLIKDRNFLIITPVKSQQPGICFIEEGQKSINVNGVRYKIKTVDNKKFKIPTSNKVATATTRIACLDYEKLSFPLQLRKWRKGDYFYPLGMRKKKKLSNFFIDNKLSINEKEKCRVLLSGKKIVWILNQRIDERFKITGKTKKIYVIERNA